MVGTMAIKSQFLVLQICMIASAGVRLFNSQALKRHKTFNGLMKNFDSLSGRFRHSIPRFENCFEAIVICQYQTEIETPSVDIIVEGMFD
jgi:hypothetical protein